jgi:CO/xanthine dehydrogenase Mo-binding subunit
MTTKPFKQSRRDFLVSSAAAGGGLALGMHLPSAFAQKIGAREGAEVNIWVVVQPDDTVLIRYARSEMGQGSMTSAPQLVAEELDCDWKKVRIEYADTNEHIRRKRAWGNMASVGSQTIRNSEDYLRKGGAAAREMLIAAAAQQWGIQARIAQGREAEGSQGLEDRGQVDAPHRHPGFGERHPALRHRHAASRHGARGGATGGVPRKRSRTCRSTGIPAATAASPAPASSISSAKD